MCDGVIVGSAREAAELLGPVLQEAGREHVAVLHLGPGRDVLHLSVAEVGGTAHVGLPIRAILAEALRLGSAGLVIGHNHPSGDARPSESDIVSTARLVRVADELGLVVHDHLVFGGGEVSSFRLLGLL